MTPTPTPTTTTLTRPRRVVYLVLEPGGGGQALRGATPRDDRKIFELAPDRPLLWANLLWGAIDRGWAIRIDPKSKPGPAEAGAAGRVLTLAVAEDSDRSWVELVPMAEVDRRLIVGLFATPGDGNGNATTPTLGARNLVERAVGDGLAVLIRCDVRLAR